jgi:hypothetical protein
VLRGKGDNTLLWISLTESPRRSGDVVALAPGLLRGFIDAQADTVHGMRSAHWPIVLQSALNLVHGRAARNREAGLL